MTRICWLFSYGNWKGVATYNRCQVYISYPITWLYSIYHNSDVMVILLIMPLSINSKYFWRNGCTGRWLGSFFYCIIMFVRYVCQYLYNNISFSFLRELWYYLRFKHIEIVWCICLRSYHQTYRKTSIICFRTVAEHLSRRTKIYVHFLVYFQVYQLNHV